MKDNYTDDIFDSLEGLESEGSNSTSQLLKIYKIDTNFYEIKSIPTQEDKIKYIINKYLKIIGQKELPELPQNIMQKDNLNYYLYTFSINEKESAWSNFLPSELLQNQTLVTQKPSLVIFAYDSQDIFAIIGGSGMQAIKRFLDFQFGLDVLSRIIDPENDNIHSAKFRGITGNLAGSAEFYRNDHKIIDTISFGRIPTEIYFQINESVLKTYFSFLNYNNRKNRTYGIASSNSFQIRASLSFGEVHILLENLLKILKTDKKVEISNFLEIKDSQLKRNLNQTLPNTIREDVINTLEPQRASNTKFDFDFCHPSNMAEFYECDVYRVYAKSRFYPIVETTDRNEIYHKTIQYIYDNKKHDNLHEFTGFLWGLMLKCTKKGNIKPLKAKFIDCISCEISPIFNKTYFCIDTRWYEIKDTFIQQLNIRCNAIIKNIEMTNNILYEVWDDVDNSDEDTYNTKYIGKPNYLVLDKKIGQNIELCDILYYDDTNVYLIHVKKGFTATMRDLVNQVTISSQRLWNDISSNTNKYRFVDAIHKSYNSSNPNPIINNLDFRKLFEKKINVVLAFTSTLKNSERISNDVNISRSNIAKYSIIQCSKEMKNDNYNFRIIEITSSK